MRLLSIPFVIGALVACGTETGNPEFLEFEYNATSSEPARVRLGESKGGVSIDTVWLRLGDVAFVDCEGESRGTLGGIGFADHGGEEAALQSLSLPGVPYCSVETRLYSDPNADQEPVDIAGASVALSGVLSDGRGFRITTDADIGLAIDAAGAEIPASGAWLVAFDVARWLDVDALEAQVGDPVVVDSETRPGLLEDFENSVSMGVFLYEDRNGNGQVDDGEPRLSE